VNGGGSRSTQPEVVGIRKVLVVSACLPPMVSGSSKMMRNLLSPFPNESLVLLRGNNPLFSMGQESSLGPAEAVDIPLFLRERKWGFGRFPRFFEYLWVPLLTFRMVRVARRERVSAIFANYPYGYFLLSIWLANRFLKLPLYVYMHSLWEETVDSALDAFMAGLFERRIFTDARAVYAPTDEAIDHYKKKHGIKVRLLPHAVDLEDGAPAEAQPPEIPDEGSPTVVFTGGIYKMNYDAVSAMVKAVETFPPVPGRGDLEMILCTTTPPRSLEAMGIRGSRVDARLVDTQTAMRLQKQADLLYLPLAFETPWVDEIRTVFPTKAVEYFVSGKPILLHGPSECFTVRDARKYGWAYVVDTRDSKALQEAVQRLLTEQSLREKLVANAWAAAARRDARKIAADLQRDMGLL